MAERWIEIMAEISNREDSLDRCFMEACKRLAEIELKREARDRKALERWSAEQERGWRDYHRMQQENADES